MPGTYYLLPTLSQRNLGTRNEVTLTAECDKDYMRAVMQQSFITNLSPAEKGIKPRKRMTSLGHRPSI